MPGMIRDCDCKQCGYARTHHRTGYERPGKKPLPKNLGLPSGSDHDLYIAFVDQDTGLAHYRSTQYNCSNWAFTPSVAVIRPMFSLKKDVSNGTWVASEKHAAQIMGPASPVIPWRDLEWDPDIRL